MTTRTATVAFFMLAFCSALALGAVCPLCLENIPEGEKYCSRHKAEMLAKTVSSAEEKKLVDALKASRASYRTNLEALEKFYRERGTADRLNKVAAELADFNKVRQFEDMNWEDRLPELSAKTRTPEADKLLEEADALRTSKNPLKRGENLKAAAEKYQQILINYPSSTAVDSAAFGLGEVHSSSRVREYARAVKFYELAYLANPDTQHDALFRAAQVADDDLAEYETAARFYWMAARTSKSMLTRERAALRLKQLQKRGFGTSYTLEQKEPQAQPAQEGERK